ncbi:recombinase family protein [Mesorhizobium sp. CO1-1-11]|uniref:recombinase family protein n=1 Tax=Mesorhizobium sp. CO1-1-11 TaxID=2876636 RepID=UPI001CCE235D|nr:recombinase family protein [Mesorhizobium sp. CO1-1-11]MBZ9725807.1 recombinase family protein [Mesorhizobium sp. CO1-1-11]
MDKLEAGDILIVTNLDRLSRDTIQVCITVKTLAEIAVRACFLALGGADLTSSTCTTMMNAFNTVAQFERDLLIARTQSGSRAPTRKGPRSPFDGQRKTEAGCPQTSRQAPAFRLLPGSLR